MAVAKERHGCATEHEWLSLPSDSTDPLCLRERVVRDDK